MLNISFFRFFKISIGSNLCVFVGRINMHCAAEGDVVGRLEHWHNLCRDHISLYEYVPPVFQNTSTQSDKPQVRIGLKCNKKPELKENLTSLFHMFFKQKRLE